MALDYPRCWSSFSVFERIHLDLVVADVAHDPLIFIFFMLGRDDVDVPSGLSRKYRASAYLTVVTSSLPSRPAGVDQIDLRHHHARAKAARQCPIPCDVTHRTPPRLARHLTSVRLMPLATRGSHTDCRTGLGHRIVYVDRRHRAPSCCICTGDAGGGFFRHRAIPSNPQPRIFGMNLLEQVLMTFSSWLPREYLRSPILLEFTPMDQRRRRRRPSSPPARVLCQKLIA